MKIESRFWIFIQLLANPLFWYLCFTLPFSSNCRIGTMSRTPSFLLILPAILATSSFFIFFDLRETSFNFSSSIYCMASIFSRYLRCSSISSLSYLEESGFSNSMSRLSFLSMLLFWFSLKDSYEFYNSSFVFNSSLFCLEIKPFKSFCFIF